MNEACLTLLRRDRDRLVAERTRLDGLIASFELVIEHYEGQPVRPAMGALKDEIHAVMSEATGPLHYREVYDRLTQRGVYVPGRDPARNVGAHLSNDRRFENCERGLWRIRPKGPSLAERAAQREVAL